MRLPCSLPAHQRTIELEAIAARTKLAVDGVEFLLMKTLSLHLIEGVIDQVAGNVQVGHSLSLLDVKWSWPGSCCMCLLDHAINLPCR